MRFSENRLIAWIALALVVVLSISLSGGKAMKDMRYEAERMFYDGAENDGLSIDNDLKMRANSVALLLSIAKSYLPENSQSLQEADAAYAELSAAREIPARHAANERVTRAVENLYTSLEKQSLSEHDKLSAYGAYKEIQNRGYTININTYNVKAREFNNSISKFPANIISQFTGVDALVLFE